MADLVAFLCRRAAPFERFNPREILVLGKLDRGKRHGTLATCSSTVTQGREIFIRYQGFKIRYLIAFFFPRFFRLDPVNRLETVIHELTHVDPSFTGVMNPLGHGRDFDRRVVETRAAIASAWPEILASPVLSRPQGDYFFRRFRRPQPRHGVNRIWSERDMEVSSLE